MRSRSGPSMSAFVSDTPLPSKPAPTGLSIAAPRSSARAAMLATSFVSNPKCSNPK